MTTLDRYDDLPAEIKKHLFDLEFFIACTDGKDTVLQCDDSDHFIDDGTIDAEDAVKAFNALVKYLRYQLVEPTRTEGRHDD
jgi:hypothetical protein